MFFGSKLGSFDPVKGTVQAYTVLMREFSLRISLKPVEKWGKVGVCSRWTIF